MLCCPVVKCLGGGTGAGYANWCCDITGVNRRQSQARDGVASSWCDEMVVVDGVGDYGFQVMYKNEYKLLKACGEGWIWRIGSLGDVGEQGGEGGELVEHSYIYTLG